MATVSPWRVISRRVIDATLAALPPDADDKAKRKALRDHYPFGERAMLPYKVWLSEVRKVLGPTCPAKPASVSFVLVGSRFVVWCEWCKVGYPRVRTRGCLACARYIETLERLAADADGQALLRGIRENPGEAHRRLIFADWLDEHDFAEVALLFRDEGD
jgi:uncharacterized protein (TIGR02996 family)